MCDDGLFALPEHLRPVPKMAAPAVKARYSKAAPKRRMLCDDCVSDIHLLGVASAPLPNPARWRRTEAGVSMLLCTKHKQERQARD